MLMTEDQFEIRFDSPQARWQAVESRDPAADGHFVYAVKTTGIYCRPACASRRPVRANVLFFDRSLAAEAAGFRACKRCRPNQSASGQDHAQRIAQACQHMQQAETCPSLRELADQAGLSPFYFQRLFKQQVGVSPRQYFAQLRAERVRSRLPESETVTGAIYDAGYGSTAQFYGQASEILGMTPTAYQQGGKGAYIRYTIQPCWLGFVLIAATQDGICGIEFADEPHDLEQRLRRRFPAANATEAEPRFADWVKEILASIEQPARSLDLPLDIQGTAFQQRVWQALRAIPAGSQVSYAEVARRIGQPGAARAVAQACASNQVALAIPCHRVVRAGGELGGYRWGVARKQQLLEREKQAAASPDDPLLV